MKSSRRWMTLSAGLAAFAAIAAAQDNAEQHQTIPFRDPAGAKKLEVSLMTAAANLTIRGVQRNDVELDSNGNFRSTRRGGEPPPGMHRLGGSGSLDVSQDNNVVRVSGSRLMGGFGDITIQVPLQTSVTVTMGLNGRVTIENVAGEIEVNHLNGDVAITNASGPVVAHSTNGRIVATLSKLAMGKAMSFSTFNGDIDVTLPADSKATLKARADNGDIFTDFDVKLEPRSANSSVPPPPGAGGGLQPLPPLPPQPPQPQAGASPDQLREQARAAAEAARQAARQASRASRVGDGLVEGSINGGGTEMQFTTFNGRILIHKK